MLSSQPQREAVSAEYGGKWIAWNADGLKIIASGDTYDQALQAGAKAGAVEPILEFVPPSDAGFVGGL